MRLPKLEGKTGSTELNRQFLGYRHVDAPDEGAFYEMENVTSERYPLMAPRPARQTVYPAKPRRAVRQDGAGMDREREAVLRRRGRGRCE